MEQFNSKLYDKYENLKKRKFVEDEEWSRKRDSNIRIYQLAAEDLIEDLKNQNDQLRSEIASMQEQYADCQKQLLEDSQKTKELSNEVGKLQNLLSRKNDSNDSASLRSPLTSPRLRSRDTCKGSSKKKTPKSRAMQNEVQCKKAAIIPHEGHQEEQYLPDCCRGNVTVSGGVIGKGQSTCTFQTFMEFLVGMKISLTCQTDGPCLSIIHQRSGYTFTLTWISHADGRDGELMYRVSSLGTLERVALDWMKEDMIFSMTMLPIFFQRISRVVGRLN